MKKASVLAVMCLLASMLLSSCISSKPCPAYRSVDPRAASVELPVNEIQQNS